MASRRSPAYHRLDSDERRRRLLELGRELFTQHPYDELSMAAIARHAGISKALLYHYFPSKQAYLVATLGDAAAELADRVRPDPAEPPAEQLVGAVDAWLCWLAENRDAYGRLVRGAAAAPEVRGLIDGVREDATRDILVRLWDRDGAPPPALRVAVRGWLWFADGVCLDWVEHGDPPREQLRDLLVRALPAMVGAAGCDALLERLQPPSIR